jgi:hypothetical protein
MPAPRLLLPVTAAVAALVVAGCSATSTGGSGKTAPASSAPSIPATDGPGVTASTITVTYRGYNAQSKATAGPIVKAIINAYNADGGIDGRKLDIVPMPFGNSPASATTAEQAQANCLAVVQSTPKIFAVLGDPADADLDPCLNSHGVPVTLGANFLVSDQTFASAPATAGMAVSTTHAAQALVNVVQNSNYLDGATSVAVVDSSADAYQSTVRSTLIPGLQKAASSVTVKEYTLTDATNGGSDNAAASSLVLRMRADHVDRVVIFGQYPSLALLVGQMVSQKFTPRLAELGVFAPYGLTSMGLQNASPDVLNNLVTFYWDATVGTPQQQQQWLNSDPAAQHCVSILTAAKLSASAATLFTALPVCEGIDLLKAALEHSGSKAVNAQAFTAGIAKLGSFQPITTFSASFGPDQHDGDSSYEIMSYQAACKCFAYTGQPQPMGSGS